MNAIPPTRQASVGERDCFKYGRGRRCRTRVPLHAVLEAIHDNGHGLFLPQLFLLLLLDALFNLGS